MAVGVHRMRTRIARSEVAAAETSCGCRCAAASRGSRHHHATFFIPASTHLRPRGDPSRGRNRRRACFLPDPSVPSVLCSVFLPRCFRLMVFCVSRAHIAYIGKYPGRDAFASMRLSWLPADGGGGGVAAVVVVARGRGRANKRELCKLARHVRTETPPPLPPSPPEK